MEKTLKRCLKEGFYAHLEDGENQIRAVKDCASSKCITGEIPEALKRELGKRKEVNSNAFKIKGSIGNTNRAAVPWVAVFDREITTSAQMGVYPVYLFSMERRTVSLSLNQGITHYREERGLRAGCEAASKVAAHIRKRLNVPDSLSDRSIDLACGGNLAKGYEAGHIVGRTYGIDELPDESVLVNDLVEVLSLYREVKQMMGPRKVEEFLDYICDEAEGMVLAEEGGGPNAEISTSDFSAEDLDVPASIPAEGPRPPKRARKSSEGKKCAPRDPDVAKRAIRSANFKCELRLDGCRTFPAENGHPYVEGHHLIPMSAYWEFDVDIDREANVVALCPYCHAMVHHGAKADVERALRSLFEKRKRALEGVGIDVGFEELKSYYEL